MMRRADGDIDDMTAIVNVMHTHGDWAHRMRLRREREHGQAELRSVASLIEDAGLDAVEEENDA